METIIAPTPYQAACLHYRPHVGVMSAGGRGSGKSFGMLLAVVKHLEEFGVDAKPLVTREQWGALTELQSTLLMLCAAAFGDASQNKSDGTITLPNGSIVQFSNVSDEKAVARLQGRSFTGIFGDEVGNYSVSAWKFLQLIRSNLRVKGDMVPELHYTANPSGLSHHTIYKNFIRKAPPWTVFKHDDGSHWIWTEGNYKGNEHINQESYRANLIAATHGDDAKRQAFLEGSWADAFGGVMFEAFDPKTHIIQELRGADFMDRRVGCDWGTHSVAAAILLGQLRHSHTLPDGRVIPHASIVAVAETSTAIDDELILGSGISVQAFAEMVLRMTKDHGWTWPYVVIDDAKGILDPRHSVVELMGSAGMSAVPPIRKSRAGHWALVNQLLTNSVTRNGRPGLYFVGNKVPCLIETLAEAPRDAKNPEDVDHKWNRDHFLDGFVYGLKHIWTQKVRSGTTTGLY